jgi:hypothetical protein
MMRQWLNAEYRVDVQPIVLFVALSIPMRLAASLFSRSRAGNVSITASNRIQQELDLLERTLLAGRLSRPSRRPRS